MKVTEDLRYPIGKFIYPDSFSSSEILDWLAKVEAAPAILSKVTSGLNPSQLDTPYRDGGWTIRQVVHHLADSHLNAYTRFRLAMTEDNPVIRPYREELWAELPDAKNGDIELSLALLEAIHRRWLILMRSFTDSDWKRTFFHPESKKTIQLGMVLALYAWHGEHHVAHISSLKSRMGWVESLEEHGTRSSGI